MEGIILLSLFILFLAFRKLQRLLTPDEPIHDAFKGWELLYADQGGGRTKAVFKSTKHRIKARPDFVYRVNPGRVAVVEYKRRHGPFFPSDIAQLAASVIAVRATYPQANMGYIMTENTLTKVDYAGSSEDILMGIEKPLGHARAVAKGVLPPPTRTKAKCRGCSVRSSCMHRT